MITTARAFALGLTLVAATAHADSKAWTAAKKVIPAGMQVVGGANFSNVRTSALYQQFLPVLLAQAGDAKTGIDAIQKQCGIDLVAALDSIAFGIDANQKGTMVIALKGTTRKELEACGQKHAKADSKTLAISAAGTLTKYSGLHDKGDVYIAWLGADVFAISTAPDDKDASTAAIAGGIATDKGFKPIAGINTNAGVWVVINKSVPLDNDAFHTTMSAAYGTVNLAKGNLDLNGHVVVPNAKDAAATAKAATGELEKLKTGALASQADALKSVTLKPAGSEVVVTASIREADVLGLIGALMRN